jgi:hypothetical protein
MPGHLRTEHGREQFLANLVQAGYLAVVGGDYCMANRLFGDWLGEHAADLPALTPAVEEESVQAVAHLLPDAAGRRRQAVILHISDLHFDDPIGRNKQKEENVHRYMHLPREVKSKLEDDLVRDLLYRLGGTLPDLVIASGNFTYWCQQGGFWEAEKCLLRLGALLAERYVGDRPPHLRS